MSPNFDITLTSPWMTWISWLGQTNWLWTVLTKWRSWDRGPCQSCHQLRLLPKAPTTGGSLEELWSKMTKKMLWPSRQVSVLNQDHGRGPALHLSAFDGGRTLEAQNDSGTYSLRLASDLPGCMSKQCPRSHFLEEEKMDRCSVNSYKKQITCCLGFLVAQ